MNRSTPLALALLVALVLVLLLVFSRGGPAPTPEPETEPGVERAATPPTAATGPELPDGGDSIKQQASGEQQAREAIGGQIRVKLVTEGGSSLTGVPVNLLVPKGPDHEQRNIHDGVADLARPTGEAVTLLARVHTEQGTAAAAGELTLTSASPPEVELQLKVDGVLLLVEACFEDQLALETEHRGDLVWSSERQSRWSAAERVGELGQVYFLHREAFRRSSQAERVALALEAWTPSGKQRYLGTSHDLSSGLEADLVRVGVVDMTALEPVVTGQVVDLTGEPVEGASVRGSVRRFDMDRAPAWMGRHRASSLRTATTDSEGRFALPAKPGVLGLVLSAGKDDMVPLEPLEVEAGSRGVTLVLIPTGGIAGRIELPEHVYDFDLLRLRLNLTRDGVEPVRGRPYQPVSPPKWSRYRDEVFGFEYGSMNLDHFGWERLPAGSYTLRVRHDLSSDYLAVVDGIQVVAGETDEDPRLAPLDISDLLSRIELTLRSEGGGVLGSTLLWFGSPPESPLILGGGAPEMSYTFHVPDLPATVFVRAEDHALEKVVLFEDATLVLHPTPRVILEVARALQLPPSCELEFQLSSPEHAAIKNLGSFEPGGHPVSLPCLDQVLVNPRLVRHPNPELGGLETYRYLEPVLLGVPPGELVTLTLPISQAELDEVAGDWLDG